MTRVFRVPEIVGRSYSPGPQPSSPGNSHIPWAGAFMGLSASAQPWPTRVGVFNLLIGNPGQARARAVIPVVNREAPAPSDFMFIRGFVGKSQG